VDGVDLEGADSHGRRLYGARRVVPSPGQTAASVDIPVTADSRIRIVHSLGGEQA
jgi:hypothetical protein